MTGVIPAKLDLHEDRVKTILNDTGYLAYHSRMLIIGKYSLNEHNWS